MIKNLIFDFGGVVVPLNPPQSWARFEALGVKDAAALMDAYCQRGIFRQVEDGSIGPSEFLTRLGELIRERSSLDSAPHITYEQAQWAWTGYVDHIDSSRLANLLRLKEQYQVILLSNTNPFMMHWADSDDFSGDGHPIGHYFHRLYYSYLMHDYKPSVSIFDKLVSDAEINPAESVFLDDGPRNVEAARQAGLNAMLVPGNEDWMPTLSAFLEKMNGTH